MTITGGSLGDGNDDEGVKVIRYTVVKGYYHILPSLNIARRNHACGHFTNTEGDIVS